MKEFVRYFAASFCLQFVVVAIVAFLFEITRNSALDVILFGLYVSPIERMMQWYKGEQPEISALATIIFSFIPPIIYSGFAAVAIKHFRSHH
jgi:hypothetical protein